MNAITSAAPANPPQSQPESLLNFVAQALHDPAIEVSKLDALLRMQREIVADERKIAFYRGMRAAQAEMRPVTRDAANATTNSRYVTFEALDRAIRPIYTKHGFLVMCDSEPTSEGVRIWCEVAHADGFSKVINAEAPLDTAGPRGTPNKTPIHGWKSAISYLRRATLEMAFNLSTTNEDDDGNAAGGTRHTGEVIAPAQLAHLSRLLHETKSDLSRFLHHVAAYAPTLADIRAADFTKCVTALENKRRDAQVRTQQKAA